MAGSRGPEQSSASRGQPKGTLRSNDPEKEQSGESIYVSRRRSSKNEKWPGKIPYEDFGLFDLAAAAAAPKRSFFSLRNALGATVILYILNQKHCLPRPLGSIVSKCLFWPTLPITVSRRIGKWTTEVDDTVLLGGAPFGFANFPERLYKKGVRGVVNMCDEYRGPTKKYEKLGMTQLRLRTVDHFSPSAEDLKSAVAFIREHEAKGKRVYVHCRAGHGRSAAAVFAWLLYKHPLADPQDLNRELLELRDVRKTLWKQPSVIEFDNWLRTGGSFGPYRRRKYPNVRRILGMEYDSDYESEDTFKDESEEAPETPLSTLERNYIDRMIEDFEVFDDDDDILDIERRTNGFSDMSRPRRNDYDADFWDDSSDGEF